ncbi:MAG: S-layer homology domain-containing protein [Defluviitaleaceae bacterium]|nr:S-layer homology domain-containing protein [Defluviitaleaceae bacterium]
MKKYLYLFLLAIFLLPATVAYGTNPLMIYPDSHTLRLPPNTPHTIEFSTWPLESAEGQTNFGYMSGSRNHILNIPGRSAGTEIDIVVTFTGLYDWEHEYQGTVTISLIIDSATPPTTATISQSSIAQGGSATLSASGGTGTGNLTFRTSGTWPQGVTINGSTVNVSNNAAVGTHNVYINVTREGINAVTLPLSFTITERETTNGQQNQTNQNQNQTQNNNNRPGWATDFTPEGATNLPPWAVQPGQQSPPPPQQQDPTLPQQSGTGGDIPLPWQQGGTMAFSDIAPNQWYYDYIMQVSDFFHGADQQFFNPDTNMTRAMFVYTLANLHNVNTHGLVSDFNDVSRDSWYAGSVAWANNSGIVQGIGEGRFAPSANITREQIAVMFLNFANFAGVNLITAGTPSFTDSAQISPWATEAVQMLTPAGVIAGRPDGTFDPQASVTRAESAAMFARFVNLLEVSERYQQPPVSQQQPPAEQPPVQQQPPVQEQEQPQPPVGQLTTPSTFNSYQQTLDYFSARLHEAIPIIVRDFRQQAEQNTGGLDALIELSLSNMERLATISVDGVGEMAAFMLRTGGDMDTYMRYSALLTEVYTELATQINDIYMEFAMRLLTP